MTLAEMMWMLAEADSQVDVPEVRELVDRLDWDGERLASQGPIVPDVRDQWPGVTAALREHERSTIVSFVDFEMAALNAVGQLQGLTLGQREQIRRILRDGARLGLLGFRGGPWQPPAIMALRFVSHLGSLLGSTDSQARAHGVSAALDALAESHHQPGIYGDFTYLSEAVGQAMQARLGTIIMGRFSKRR